MCGMSQIAGKLKEYKQGKNILRMQILVGYI